jgi:hypothetical protein
VLQELFADRPGRLRAGHIDDDLTINHRHRMSGDGPSSGVHPLPGPDVITPEVRRTRQDAVTNDPTGQWLLPMGAHIVERNEITIDVEHRNFASVAADNASGAGRQIPD